jgi:hypothetical protein
MVARLTHTEDVGDAYNVTWGVGTNAGLTEQEMVNLNMTWFGEAWAQELDTAITIESVTGYFGNTPPADPSIVISTNTPRPGERTTGSLPPNCAVLLQKRTGLGGRKNRGRLYMPHSVPEGAVNEAGIIDSVWVATHNTQAAIWMDRLTNGGGTSTPTPMVVLHSLPSDPLPTPVTQLIAQSTLATQRRRLRR